MSGVINYTNCPCCDSGNIHRILDIKDHSISKEIFSVWQCEDCRLRFTQAVPGEDAIARYYHSDTYISHSDTKKGIISSLYHRVRKITLASKRRIILSRSKKNKGSLLDLGCGTGAFLNEMKKTGWEVTGVEPEAIARQKAKALYGIEPLGPSKLAELPAASFDVITLWHVLEHVHDLHGYTAQLKKLLKPGGILLIAVPNYTSADAGHYHYYWAAYDVPRHLYHFSPQSVHRLMNLHGMEVKEELPMWFDAYYVSMLSEQYKGSPMPVFSGTLKGAWFSLQTIFNRRKCSSLVYLIKKTG